MLTILTGPVHSGKTSLLEGLCRRWEDADTNLRGFLSLCVHEDGQRAGYDLFDLSDGTKWPFLRLGGGPDWENVGPFSVVPETLAKASSIIRSVRPGEILVIDEAGPLELAGQGLRPALDEVLRRPILRILLVIRKEILGDFLPLMEAGTPAVYDVRDPGVGISLARALSLPETQP